MTSFIRTVLATCLGVVLAAMVIYGSCSYLVNRDVHRLVAPIFPPALPPPAPLTFQQKMFNRGYRRDHLTHRWYSLYDSLMRNGCRISGPPLDTTFTCARPLNPADGIPDR
jgi:hypothetical protein